MPLEVVVKNACSTVGEGPHWDEDSQMLYFVDIYANSVSKWSVGDGAVHTITLDKTIGFAIPSVKGDIIIGLGQSFARLEWDTKRVTVIETVDQNKQTRMNDGKCDSKGRLWAGTMGMEKTPGDVEMGQGSLYCLDTERRVIKHLENLNIPNGIVWSKDDKTMFFIDSSPGFIYAFDYDIEHASLKNQRVLFQCQPSPHNTLGSPDGMTIDKDGKLWIACFFGGRIIQFDPDSKTIVHTQHTPALRPSSCCFGGSGYDQLYVTSSCYGCKDEELALYPLSGSVFRITAVGTTGFPLAKYNG